MYMDTHDSEGEIKFYPTKKLKEAGEKKPIMSYIPENGCDPNPAWDDVARSVWPSTKEHQTHREAMASALMWSIYDDTVGGAAPNAAIILARMCQRLMGDEWMEMWLLINRNPLTRRISDNKRKFGGAKKFFKNLISSF
jgi:hypothetical protein